MIGLPLPPQSAFPGFYENDVIRALARRCRWTISGQIGELEDDQDEAQRRKRRKAPIDLRELLRSGRVRGAFDISDQCLVTLDELASALPQAANCAFYLQAGCDGVMVLDIEPGCPPEVARDLLRLPGVLYSELSMSGRGYHLVTALPENRHRFPAAARKRVLRHPEGWYELLLEHWVTFTRKPIPVDVLQAAAEPEFSTVDELYASLASAASASASGPSSTAVRTEVEAPAIKGSELIVERTLEGARPRLKELDHFGGDRSRWEFSILGTLDREMHRHLVRVGFLRRTEYSDSDRAWLLYTAAQQAIPHRAKHEERRNGRPFLLDRAAAMVALNPHDGEGGKSA